jgi:hypothetical protein
MSTYLVHYGIKGMKWGVRRYQNADGSYTDAGRKRRELGNSLKRNAGIRRSKALRDARRRNIDELSTEELREINKRLQEEENYVRLTKGGVSKGKEWIGSTGKTIATAVITGVFIQVGKTWIKTTFGL